MPTYNLRRRRVSLAAFAVGLATAAMLSAVPAGATGTASIAGSVLTPADPAAAGAAQITLYDSTGSVVQSTPADPGGGYDFTGLDAGAYTLFFSVGGAHAGEFLPEWWNDAADQAHATAVTVTDGEQDLPAAELTAIESPDPMISGTAQPDQVLTAETGTWVPTPDSFGYEWFADNVPIAGQTSSSYTVGRTLVGAEISVAVTAFKADADPITTTSAQSTVTAASFADVAAPVVTGNPVLGGTLSAGPLSWIPEPDSVDYQWLRDSLPISNATGASYTIASVDELHTIAVRVSGRSTGYLQSQITSVAFHIPSVSTAAHVTGSVQGISGIRAVGSTLQAVPARFTPGNRVLSYQWYRGQFLIPGATGIRYKLQAVDGGKHLLVKVTGAATGFLPFTAVSNPTAVIARKLTAGVPAVGGTARYGHMMVALPGTWTTGTLLHYQWYAKTAKITGATSKYYVPKAVMINKWVHVTVTGTKLGYVGVAHSSASHLVGVGIFSAVPLPRITGALGVGQVLHVSMVAMRPTPALHYQWLRDGLGISGAVTAGHTIVSSDIGRHLSVKVTATRGGYRSVVHYTARSAAVPAPAPKPTPAPSPSPAPAPPSGGCTPGYSPCIPDLGTDVDCANGSGNGPRYVDGPVYVTGPDIYDLDRDGDGVGCES